MANRNKPGLAFWAIVVVVVGMVYFGSFGPACWVCSRVPQSGLSWEITDFVYSPILLTWWQNDQGTLGNVISSYANLGAKRRLTVAKQLDGSYCLIEVFPPPAPPSPKPTYVPIPDDPSS